MALPRSEANIGNGERKTATTVHELTTRKDKRSYRQWRKRIRRWSRIRNSGITKLWFSDPPLLFCCELLLSRWPRCLIRLSMICSSLRRIGIVMIWFAVRSALQVVAWFAGLWFSHRKSRRWCLVILEINVNGERWSYGFSMVEGLVNRCRLLKTWWRLVMPLAITKSFFC